MEWWAEEPTQTREARTKYSEERRHLVSCAIKNVVATSEVPAWVTGTVGPRGLRNYVQGMCGALRICGAVRIRRDLLHMMQVILHVVCCPSRRRAAGLRRRGVLRVEQRV